MQSPISENECPQCHTPLLRDAPQGLCPKCLMQQAAFDTGNAIDGRETGPSMDALSASFPQFEILELIGQGGMGCVYKVKQKSLGRIVALKVMNARTSTNATFPERFAREAQALAELNHPNIVTIHDFGCNGDLYYLLMEFVDGVNLRQAMNAGKFTPQEALAVVPPICEALQFAHLRGIVHRDIKPENLLLDRQGRIKIADFGIARMLFSAVPKESSANDQNKSPIHASLTKESVIGTPRYMAPEQVSAPEDVDQRADIYSLGVVLYEMLTGELPTSKLEAPSRKTHLDARLDEVVLRALQQEPDNRYRTAEEMTLAIQSALNPSTGTEEIPSFRRCAITTPQRLAGFWTGTFRPFQFPAEIAIGDRSIHFQVKGRTTVVPLDDIAEVNILNLPWRVTLMGQSYLSVSWRQPNAMSLQSIGILPTESLTGYWKTNLTVESWADEIKSNIVRATGRTPISVKQMPTWPARHPGWMKALGVGIVFMALWCFFTITAWGSAPFKPLFSISAIGFFLTYSAAILLWVRWLQNRREGVPAATGTGWLWIGLLGSLLTVIVASGTMIAYYRPEKPQVLEWSVGNAIAEGNIVFVDVHFRLGGTGIERYLGYRGPRSNDALVENALEAAVGQNWRPIFASPYNGNTFSTILSNINESERFAFVLPDAKTAELAAEDARKRQMLFRDPIKLDPGTVLTLFHVSDDYGNEYRATEILTHVRFPKDASCVSGNVFHQWNELQFSMVCELYLAQETQVLVEVGGEKIDITIPARTAPSRPDFAKSSIIKLEGKRLSREKSQITLHVGERQLTKVLDMKLTQITDSLRLLSPSNIKSFRGTPIEIFRFGDRPVVLTVGLESERPAFVDLESLDQAHVEASKP